MTLADLKPGRSGVVTGAGELRLMELGFAPGTEVKMIRVSPPGDPIAVELRGYCLALRKSAARQISVRAR